jgi:hypothetical protein
VVPLQHLIFSLHSALMQSMAQDMDSDKERDFGDQGLLTDTDVEEDTQILATFLKHVP